MGWGAGRTVDASVAVLAMARTGTAIAIAKLLIRAKIVAVGHDHAGALLPWKHPRGVKSNWVSLSRFPAREVRIPVTSIEYHRSTRVDTVLPRICCVPVHPREAILVGFEKGQAVSSNRCGRCMGVETRAPNLLEGNGRVVHEPKNRDDAQTAHWRKGE